MIRAALTRLPSVGVATRLFAATLTLFVAPLAAQEKRAITHDDYDNWPSIRGSAYSPDGAWIAYQIQPAQGDGELRVRQVDGDKEHVYPLGSGARFTADGKHVIFTVGESKAEERRKKIERLYKGEEKKLEEEAKKAESEAATRREEMMARFRAAGGRRGFRPGAGDSSTGGLRILDLTTGEVEELGKTKGHRLVADGAFLVYRPEEKKEEKGDKKEGDKKEGEEKEGQNKAGEKKEGPAKSAAAEPAAGPRGRRPGAGGRRGARSGEGRRGMRGAGRGPRQEPEARSKNGGSPLVVRNLGNGEERRYEAVSSYSMIADDTWMLIVRAENEKHQTEAGLEAMQMAEGRTVTLQRGEASYRSFTTDKAHRTLAFASDAFDKRIEAEKKAAEKKAAEAAKKAAEEAKKAAEGKGEKAVEEKPKTGPADKADTKKAEKTPKARYDIYMWDFSGAGARRMITADAKGLPGDAVVQSGGLSFSDDGSVLMFGIKGKDPEDMPKILPEDEVTLDIWHWNDPLIQPMQARRRDSHNPTLSTAWHVQDGRAIVLGDELIPSMRLITRDGSRAIATDSRPYAKAVSYDGRYSDVYLVNTVDGSRTKVLERHRGRQSTSPTGRWMLSFGADYHWYAMNVETMEQRCLTKGLGVAFHNVLEDRPQPASAYGVVGWTENDDAVLINDRYDIWKIQVASGEAACMTDGYGRANKIVLRYESMDYEGKAEDPDFRDRDHVPATMLLSAKNDVTKARGYYVDSSTRVQRPRKLAMMDRAIGGLTRAKSTQRLFFTMSTFAQFPDIWVSDWEFGSMKQLTDACPIQREVNWGSSELVTWNNDDGVALQGILIKPDGFDPKKQYPMMVYFYERNADNVHRYTRPSPGTSPNAAYYVSNGYLWFVPDIVYTRGYPGESAEKCIISGVQHLLAQGFVKRDSIGTAGHSWGGYQTAHLVTRTNLFAAAESGAPVSNMFSAYGGIRYSSGMSRQFQYERTQSRIGGTPWEYPQRYWQNSPVFYADRVETPVLILHNDEDGAVPWTNGIEFFMALRRMEKESYLFNYNGEAHGLRRRANQKDWTRRMQQFFDHHLKGAPAPEWMTEGVPFIDRQREKIPHAPSYREAIQMGLTGKPAAGAAGAGGDR